MVQPNRPEFILEDSFCLNHIEAQTKMYWRRMKSDSMAEMLCNTMFTAPRDQCMLFTAAETYQVSQLSIVSHKNKVSTASVQTVHALHK